MEFLNKFVIKMPNSEQIGVYHFIVWAIHIKLHNAEKSENMKIRKSLVNKLIH